MHNWPVTREISKSFKFCHVELAGRWHDALRPLLRITWFLRASWPVQRSSVEVTSKFREGGGGGGIYDKLALNWKFLGSGCSKAKVSSVWPDPDAKC